MASRIDFGIISQGMVDCCENTGYITGLHSDHLAFFLYIQLRKNPRGPGYWKLNCSHLTQQDYVNLINETIKQVNTLCVTKTPKEKWEYLKFRVREESMEYARNKASEISLIIAQLSEKVCEYEDNLEECDLNLLHQTKLDLEEFMDEKTKSCIFRSKANFAEHGEKPTAYFLNLEKARYNSRTCNALYDENGLLQTNTKAILALQERFYKNLYTADPEIRFAFDNTYGIELSEDYRAKYNVAFTIDEIQKAIKQLPNNKTCGNDGLPIEFYKLFWVKIKDAFMEMIEESYNTNQLPHSAMLGVINLIPKQSGNLRYLKLLRPITLLNCDYKSVEKALANRMEAALDIIISDDQQGFRKGRRICCNIRTIYELIRCAEETDLEALILSFDFEKCFDKIEFQAIFGSLSFFGFPQYMIDWVKIMYSGFQANTQNNGHFSNRFYIGRGVHRGGPCSSLIFLVCAEILSILLKDHPDIKGFPVKDILKLLGQYADDADIYMIKNQKSLDSVFDVLEKFRSLSGFTLNYNKTSILRIGSFKKSMDKLITQRTVAWTNEPINVLGVLVTTKQEEISRINYAGALTKIQSIFAKWGSRNLSLIGKSVVVNSLIASLFVYKMTVIPRMPDHLLQKLNRR